MKRITVFSIVCLLIIVGRAFSAPQTSTARPTAWSQEVNGLEGSLSVNFENLKDGPRQVMTLELHNVSMEPVSITNQPMFNAQLFDAQGKEIPNPPSFWSLPSSPPQYAVIPGAAYLRFQVDMTTSFAPSKNTVLLFMRFNLWHLKPGKYTLQSSMFIPKNEDNKDQWTGKMKLPAVTLL